MKRSIAAFMFAGLIVLATTAQAHEGSGHGSKTPMAANPTQSTITGELVDTGCYLAHAARGSKHVGCATKCVSGEMPMGLLTARNVLYLLTPNHDNPDPYHDLKKMSGKTISVTGLAMERGGMKGLDVTSFRVVEVR